MRTILILTALLAVNAHAMSIFNCDVAAESKYAPTEPVLIKKMFISPAFMNEQLFHETKLNLTVDIGGSLLGSVNDQYRFILSGTPKEGMFESAYHKGRIRCAEAVEQPYMLQFKPWNQFFTLEPGLSVGHILNRIDTSLIRLNLVCFIGDIQAAEAAISKHLGIKGRISEGYKIDYTFTYTDCIRGHGSQDNWTCEEQKTYEVTVPVVDCAGAPTRS